MNGLPRVSRDPHEVDLDSQPGWDFHRMPKDNKGKGTGSDKKCEA
jgi:hypothetical protein